MGQTRCCLTVFIFLAGLKYRSSRRRHISAELSSCKRTENVRTFKPSWFYSWATGELLPQLQLPGLTTRWKQSSNPVRRQTSAFFIQKLSFLLPPFTFEFNSRLDVNFRNGLHLRHTMAQFKGFKNSAWGLPMMTFTGLTNGRCLELHQNLLTGSLDQHFTLNLSVVWRNTKLGIRSWNGNVPCSWAGCTVGSRWNAAMP